VLENVHIGMAQEVNILSSNYGNCKQCGERLGRFNHTNPKRKNRLGLCQKCIRFPNDEFRCVHVYPDSDIRPNRRGKRCKLHKVVKSNKGYCGVHKRMFEDGDKNG